MSAWIVPLWVGLALAAWTDGRDRRVPNVLTGPLALLGLAIAASDVGPVGLKTAMASMMTAFVVMVGPFALRIFKGGDLKLIVAASAWLDPPGVIWAIGIGIVLGGLMGLVQTLAQPGGLRTVCLEIRLIILSAKMKAPETSASRSTVPMAIAFGAGVFWVSVDGLVWL